MVNYVYVTHCNAWARDMGHRYFSRKASCGKHQKWRSPEAEFESVSESVSRLTHKSSTSYAMHISNMSAGPILVDIKIAYLEAKEPSIISLSLNPDIKIADLNTRLRSELGEFEQGHQDDSSG